MRRTTPFKGSKAGGALTLQDGLQTLLNPNRGQPGWTPPVAPKSKGAGNPISPYTTPAYTRNPPKAPVPARQPVAPVSVGTTQGALIKGGFLAPYQEDHTGKPVSNNDGDYGPITSGAYKSYMTALGDPSSPDHARALWTFAQLHGQGQNAPVQNSNPSGTGSVVPKHSTDQQGPMQRINPPAPDNPPKEGEGFLPWLSRITGQAQDKISQGIAGATGLNPKDVSDALSVALPMVPGPGQLYAGAKYGSQLAGAASQLAQISHYPATQLAQSIESYLDKNLSLGGVNALDLTPVGLATRAQAAANDPTGLNKVVPGLGDVAKSATNSTADLAGYLSPLALPKVGIDLANAAGNAGMDKQGPGMGVANQVAGLVQSMNPLEGIGDPNSPVTLADRLSRLLNAGAMAGGGALHGGAVVDALHGLDLTAKPPSPDVSRETIPGVPDEPLAREIAAKYPDIVQPITANEPTTTAAAPDTTRGPEPLSQGLHNVPTADNSAPTTTDTGNDNIPVSAGSDDGAQSGLSTSEVPVPMSTDTAGTTDVQATDTLPDQPQNLATDVNAPQNAPTTLDPQDQELMTSIVNNYPEIAQGAGIDPNNLGNINEKITSQENGRSQGQGVGQTNEDQGGFAQGQENGQEAPAVDGQINGEGIQLRQAQGQANQETGDLRPRGISGQDRNGETGQSEVRGESQSGTSQKEVAPVATDGTASPHAGAIDILDSGQLKAGVKKVPRDEMSNDYLDAVTSHNDAVDAVKGGIARDDYVSMHKDYAKPLAEASYDSASGERGPRTPLTQAEPEQLAPISEKPNVSPEPNSEPEKFASSNAASNDVRASATLAPLPEKSPFKRGSLEESLHTFDPQESMNRARQAVDDVAKGGKPQTHNAEQSLHAGMLEAHVSNVFNDAKAKLADAIKAGEPTAHLEDSYARAKADLDIATLAHKYVGTEMSHAFSNRNRAVAQDYTPAGLYREFVADTKRTPTTAEQASIDDIAAKYRAATDRIVELEKNARKGNAQGEVTRAARQSARAGSIDNIRKSRADALSRLKTKFEAHAKNSTANADPFGIVAAGKGAHLLADIAPEVMEIVKGYAHEGIIKLGDVVERVKGDIKAATGHELSDDDVHRIISGDYPRDKANLNRSDAVTKVQEWRKELSDAKRDTDSKSKVALKADSDAKVAESQARDAQNKAEQQAARVQKQNELQDAFDADKKAQAEVGASNKADAATKSRQDKAASQAVNDAQAQARAQKQADMKAALADQAEQTKQALRADSAAKVQAAKDFASQKAQAAKSARADHAAKQKDYNDSLGKLNSLQNRIDTLTSNLNNGHATVSPEFRQAPVDPQVREAQIKVKSLEHQYDAVKNQALRNDAYKAMNPVQKGIKEVLGGAQRLVASGNFHFAGNHGKIAWMTHPITSAKAFWSSWKAYANEANFNTEMGRMRADPDYDLAMASNLKLGVNDPTVNDIMLGSRILNKSIEVGPEGHKVGLNPIANADRAYAVNASALRLALFKQLVKSAQGSWVAKLRGKDVKLSDADYKNLASHVNRMTGASDSKIANTVSNLNEQLPVLFSPRYLVSKWEWALGGKNLVEAARSNPAVAEAMFKDYVKWGGAAALIYGITKTMGGKQENDIHSSNFGLVDMPAGYKVDPFAGAFKPYTVAAQVLQGSKTAAGKSQPSNPAATAGNYLTSKLSPIPALVTHIAAGKAFGKSYDVRTDEGRKNAAQSMLPIAGPEGVAVMNDPKLTPEQKAVIMFLVATGHSLREPQESTPKKPRTPRR